MPASVINIWLILVFQVGQANRLHADRLFVLYLECQTNRERHLRLDQIHSVPIMINSGCFGLPLSLGLVFGRASGRIAMGVPMGVSMLTRAVVANMDMRSATVLRAIIQQACMHMRYRRELSDK